MALIEQSFRFDERFASKGFPGFFGNEEPWMTDTICEVFSEQAQRLGVSRPIEIDVFGHFDMIERLTWISVVTDLLDEQPPIRKFIGSQGEFYLGRMTLQG